MTSIKLYFPFVRSLRKDNLQTSREEKKIKKMGIKSIETNAGNSLIVSLKPREVCQAVEKRAKNVMARKVDTCKLVSNDTENIKRLIDAIIAI